jgi:hypothetical protein
MLSDDLGTKGVSRTEFEDETCQRWKANGEKFTRIQIPTRRQLSDDQPETALPNSENPKKAAEMKQKRG